MESKQVNILAIGRNAEIIKVLERLINQTWSGTGVITDEEAIAIFHKQPFDIVLFSNGITDKEKAELEKNMAAHNPAVIFIQHMGGGSGLLQNEIFAALDNRDKKRS